MAFAQPYRAPADAGRLAGGGAVGTGAVTPVDLLIVFPAIFLIPATMFLEVHIVGRLFLPEIMLAGLLPFLLLARGKTLKEPMPRLFLIFAFLWLVGQIGTDLYVGTPFQDFSRGWAKIMNTMINFMAIYLITYKSRKRLEVFAIGVTVGYLLIYLFNPGEQMEEDPWKFGLGLSVSLFFCGLATFKRIYRTGVMPIALLLVPAALSLQQNSRSLAGICFISAVYVTYQFYIGSRKGRAQKISPSKIAILIVVGLASAYGALQLYGFAAGEGLLGRDAKSKYEMQSQGKFGILLGGRAEIFVSVQAITQSPIIGHGSWAKDPKYAAMLLKLEDFGYEISSTSFESGLIPSHSHIFGAWVEAGILGATFWLVVLFMVIWVLIKLTSAREPLAPLAAFVGTILFWDILFSPFGAERRILIPFYVVVLMAASTAVDFQHELAKARGGRKSAGAAGRPWWHRPMGR